MFGGDVYCILSQIKDPLATARRQGFHFKNKYGVLSMDSHGLLVCILASEEWHFNEFTRKSPTQLFYT